MSLHVIQMFIKDDLHNVAILKDSFLSLVNLKVLMSLDLYTMSISPPNNKTLGIFQFMNILHESLRIFYRSMLLDYRDIIFADKILDHHLFAS
jgi:hypothetical protein